MAASRGSLLTAAAVVAVAFAAAGLPKLTPPSLERPSESATVQALRAEVAELANQQRTLLARQEALSAGIAEADSRSSEKPELSEASLGTPSMEVEASERRAAPAPDLDERDRRDTLREDILRPVFQIVGEEAVGSGVLIHRGSDEEGDYYLALSCYHVLRDILAERPDAVAEEFVFTVCFDQLGEDNVYANAKLLRQEPRNDLALMRIEAKRDLGPIAAIAPLERALDVRPFTPVYTVGCPLGTGAQATLGEVTREDWAVSDEPYWMVSSPAYFGNSGGGVFLEDTHELVGIFSKIYTHGNYRPQVVTHMGLAVPLQSLHSWLREIGYADILPESTL